MTNWINPHMVVVEFDNDMSKLANEIIRLREQLAEKEAERHEIMVRYLQAAEKLEEQQFQFSQLTQRINDLGGRNAEQLNSECEDLAKKLIERAARIAELKLELAAAIELADLQAVDIAELKAQLAEARKAGEWIEIGIGSFMPKDLEVVLIYADAVDVATWSNGNFWEDENFVVDDVTHWMHKPAPPQAVDPDEVPQQ